MMVMYLKQGKFYEGKKQVPLEFGNAVQIRLMNEALNNYNALTNSGLILDVEEEETIELSFQFKCTCGEVVYKSRHVYSRNDLGDLTGKERCQSCGTKYKIELTKDKTLIAFIEKK